DYISGIISPRLRKTKELPMPASILVYFDPPFNSNADYNGPFQGDERRCKPSAIPRLHPPRLGDSCRGENPMTPRPTTTASCRDYSNYGVSLQLKITRQTSARRRQ